jgi:hypothetical protein
MQKEYIILMIILLLVGVAIFVHRQFQNAPLLSDKEDEMYFKEEQKRFLWEKREAPRKIEEPPLYVIVALFFICIFAILLDYLRVIFSFFRKEKKSGLDL